ncbi:hypothetical protein A5658_01445 [Mycobacterium sp. 1245111.1]|uniref:hypothetical protein n=1 Tax=Mycobacterium sp. 1245111.1 TaxID=1834073 RepID=UPI0007FBDE3D|nr:hypothetical protein [Mycobacterium sp. 1245111.1]OBK34097.1 hypothetical protein A5658_01445 [Mycobacterium sp. 1245111.1]
MARSAYEWLPDRHLGVAATLSHADELIGQISNLLYPYQTQEGGIVRLREVRHGSVSRTVVDGVAPIPRKLPLLVADALVTMRASIEHVLFAEVEYLDGPVNEKAAKLVEMPAAESWEAFEEWKKKRRKNGSPSLQAGSELVRRIAALQPFHRHVNPELHPLARLVSHTNHAKHRTPAVVAVGLAGMYEDANVPRSIEELPRGQKGPLRAGDVIAETPLGTQVPATLFPTVGINRPGTDEWPVLLTELDEIATWVRDQAVPRLVTGGEPPEPALPVRYDISVAHADDRRAIELGTSTTAAKSHALRLSAADGRRELVEHLHTTHGSLNPEVLTAWLTGLSDDDVNKRMERLAATAPQRGGNAHQTLAVLEDLRDEAVAFASNHLAHE